VSFASRAPDPVITPSETPRPGALRAGIIDISNGGELVIFFERLRADRQTAGSSEMPLLAVLRDTMGDADPTNDRLRQVWIFTYAAASPAQRTAAGVPFFDHRLGLNSGRPRARLILRPIWRGRRAVFGRA
jgi:hypothetical protein